MRETFATTEDDEARELREEAEARERGRLGMIDALRAERAGYEHRAHRAELDIARIADELDGLEPHWSELKRAELAEATRRRDRMNGRIALVDNELKTRKK